MRLIFYQVTVEGPFFKFIFIVANRASFLLEKKFEKHECIAIRAMINRQIKI